MARETRRGNLALAAWGWFLLALLSVVFASAAERGVVIIEDRAGNEVAQYKESFAGHGYTEKPATAPTTRRTGWATSSPGTRHCRAGT